MNRGHRTSEVAVVGKLHDLMPPLFTETGRMPRQVRFGLGTRMEEAALCVLMRLVEASYDKRRRAEILKSANLEIEKLRHLFRVATNLKVMPHKKVDRLLDELEEIVGRAAVAGCRCA